MTDGRSDHDLRECDVNRFEAYAISESYVRDRGAQQYREIYDVIHPLQPSEHPRPLRRSPFYSQQQDLGAVFFESRGWESPRWYEANGRLIDKYGIPDRTGWAGRFWSPIAGVEHVATRERAALFDMTTLTKIEVSGPGSGEWLESLASNKVVRRVGSVTYALLLDERGRHPERHYRGASRPGMVPDRRQWSHGRRLVVAGAAGGDVGSGARCHWGAGLHRPVGTAGPRHRPRVSSDDWSNEAFPYYTCRQLAVGEVPVRALRVSYVGELGWELYTTPEYGGRLWQLLWDSGQEDGLIAAGRAAFDTLRLEKGYRLWGADMHSEYRPDEAGVAFAVKAGKGAFKGREALDDQDGDCRRRLVCLRLNDPRHIVMGKEPVVTGDSVVGYVTSAGFGYAVGESLAYAYVPADCAIGGMTLCVESFNERLPATVVSEPRWDPTGRGCAHKRPVTTRPEAGGFQFCGYRALRLATRFRLERHWRLQAARPVTRRRCRRRRR